ncbi:type II secretion system ATPase GspE [Hyphococcus formosus]|uniref:type II secretion system ATPase GspE n=1 Tax=Hyphococcus formosus TaxID=3143534 RepID=UPI00398AA0BE
MSEQSTISSARFSYAFAKERGLIVLDDEVSPVVLGARGATPEPWAIIEARRAIGAPIKVDILPPEMFERRLSEIYSVEGISAADLDLEGDESDLASLAEGLPKTADLLDSENDAPVIRLINAMIAEAVKVKASDIHIEPYEKTLSIRLRIDGVLREVLSLPSRMTPVLTSRVKVMARLDIAERRVPQDGRISLALGGRTVDVRVSTLPARFGERVVMRILDKDEARLDLDGLGMPALILERFKQVLQRPNGIILVTGPTGSGKTTTLYGALSVLNEPSRNILTVEDPVEYAVDGVGQTQINPKVGMTFATGLRAILRQDPDIVMVGEIRDVETAEIAVQASLTGHLVLSTVHTNSAAGAITRLRDMGVEPFLLSSTVVAVLAQRLVRRLCPSCKETYSADEATKKLLGVSGNVQLMRPVGCGRCNQTGYEGRIGVYELIIVDDQMKRLIHDNGSEHELEDYAFRNVDTLAQSGFKHVLNGVTSVEEVMRVVRKEGDNASL